MDPSSHPKIGGAGRPEPTSGAAGPARAREGAAATGGVAFRALLEDLERRARELRREGEGIEDPGTLAGAVRSAKGSLDDALTLSEKLLEAWRQAARTEPHEPDGAGGRPTTEPGGGSR